MQDQAPAERYPTGILTLKAATSLIWISGNLTGDACIHSVEKKLKSEIRTALFDYSRFFVCLLKL